MRPSKVRDGIYMSDGQTARDHGEQFDHVLTLSKDREGPDVGPHEHTTQHFPLRDGKNPQEAFNRAVQAAVKMIETHDGDVLIHCQAGVSRSATVLITALAYIDGVRFSEARDEVWEARPSISPHPELRELALNFLGEDPEPF